MINRKANEMPFARLGHLTRREYQIAPLLASGRTDREIARQLNRSPSTVNKQIAGIKRKIGAGTRCEAVRILIHEKKLKPSNVVQPIGKVKRGYGG